MLTYFVTDCEPNHCGGRLLDMLCRTTCIYSRCGTSTEFCESLKQYPAETNANVDSKSRNNGSYSYSYCML